MKLVKNNSYLLLIDEEAKIKEGDYILEKEYIINIFPDYLTDLDECKKLIAYYPLTKDAQELDLPLLPNPFEVINIEELADKAITNNPLDWIKGYKAAQSKQYSLEDVEKAIDMARLQGSEPFLCKYSDDEIIQSLSTQQPPKEFIPEYYTNGDMIVRNRNEVRGLVGTYKY